MGHNSMAVSKNQIHILNNIENNNNFLAHQFRFRRGIDPTLVSRDSCYIVEYFKLYIQFFRIEIRLIRKINWIV